MIFIFYSLLIVGIYVVLCLGLTILFCPQPLKKYIPFLAPIIGYSYLTLAGWYCYNLKLGGTDVYAIPVLVFPALLLLFIVFRKKAVIANHLRSLFSDRNFLTACAIAFLGFLIVSLPIIFSDNSLNSITIGNADISNYAIVSRYLKEFPRDGGIGFFAQQHTTLKWHLEESVFGALLSTSFSASLLDLDVYQIQSMTINIFFAFSVGLAYAIARQIFQYNYWGASGVTTLYALNPVIYYTIYHGFQSQIIAISLSLGILLLNIETIHNCQKVRDYYIYIPLAVLLNWAMSLTYPHMLLLLYAPIVVYLAWYSLHKQSWRLLLYHFLFILVSLLIMSVLSLQRLKALINYLFIMKAAQAGWFVPFIAPNEVFIGFKDKNNLEQILIAVILSILVIGLIYLGFAQAKKSDFKLLPLVCSLSLITYFGAIVLSLQYLASSGQFGGYKAYKLLSFFVPQILLGWLLYFQNIKANFKTKKASFFTVLLVVVAIGTYNITSSAIKHHASVTQPLIELQKIENNPAIKSINILGLADGLQIMWKSYFLARKDLYFQTPVYFPNPPGSNLNGEWDLLNSQESKVPQILKVKEFRTDPSASIVLNSSYTLEKADASFWALLEKGWQGFDGTRLWSGGDTNSSAILINSPSSNLPIDIKLVYSPLKPDDRLSIHLNQQKVADCQNNQSCMVQNLVLAKGKNILEFKASLPPSLAGNGDPRPLSYAFSSIEIAASKLEPTK